MNLFNRFILKNPERAIIIIFLLIVLFFLIGRMKNDVKEAKKSLDNFKELLHPK